MDLDVTFLGTAASVPSAARGMPAVQVRYGSTRILVDCGEGTQRQLMRSTGMSEVDLVLITHGHMDHYLGLPAMLKTFALRERERPLRLAFPREFSRIWQHLDALVGRLPYRVQVTELAAGDELEEGGLTVHAFETRHSAPSLGYRIQEPDLPGRFDVEAARELGVRPGPAFGQLQHGKPVVLDDGTEVRPEQVVGETRRGRAISITGDTSATPAVRDAVMDSDLLVHEATFASDEDERARQTRHSTAADAAMVAAAARVRMLALVHISTRYPVRTLLDEARAIFPDTICPRDLDSVVVPLADRGPLQHVRQEPARPQRTGDRAAESTPAPTS